MTEDDRDDRGSDVISPLVVASPLSPTECPQKKGQASHEAIDDLDVDDANPIRRVRPPPKWVQRLTPGQRSVAWKVLLLLTTILTAMQLYLLALGSHYDPKKVVGTGTVLGNLCLGYWIGCVPYLTANYRHFGRHNFQKDKLGLVVAGICLAAGYTGYMLLLASGGSSGQSTILIPATSLYILVPVSLGVLLRGERWSALKCVALILSVSALILLAGDFESGKVKFDLLSGKQAGYFVACIAFWGLQTFFLSIQGGSEDHTTTIFCTATGLLIGSLVCSGAILREYEFSRHTSYILSVCAGVTLMITHVVFFKLSALITDVSIVNPLASTYVVWGVLLGFLPPLYEPPRITKFVGLALAMATIFLLSRPPGTKLGCVLLPCVKKRPVIDFGADNDEMDLQLTEDDRDRKVTFADEHGGPLDRHLSFDANARILKGGDFDDDDEDTVV